MREPVFFRNGLRKKFWCDRCDMETMGIVIRDRFEWILRFDCGHEIIAGFVLPQEELERRGIINAKSETIDPRLISRVQSARREFLHREFEKIYKLLKGVSHWMDKTGGIHVNPCFGKPVWQIDRLKSIGMNKEEFKIVYEGILRLLAYKRKHGILETCEKDYSTIALSRGGRKVKDTRKDYISPDRENRRIKMGVHVERYDVHGP